MLSSEQPKPEVGWESRVDKYELEVVNEFKKQTQRAKQTSADRHTRWDLLQKNNLAKTHSYQEDDGVRNELLTGDEKAFIKTEKYKNGDYVWYNSFGGHAGKKESKRTKWRATTNDAEFIARYYPHEDDAHWSPEKISDAMLQKKEATTYFLTAINEHLKNRRVVDNYEESDLIKEYRGIVELLIKDPLLRTKVFAEIFDEAVLFALLMIVVDDACNLQKCTASEEKQAYQNLERYLIFLNAREELIEQNLDNTESIEFSLWSMSGIEFSEIRQAIDEELFASLPVFVEHVTLNHIEEENPKHFSKNENSKDIENDLYWSPLAHATKYGNLKCIKLLLDARFRADASHQIKFYDEINQISRISAFRTADDNPTPYDLALIGKHYGELYPGDIGFDADSAWDPILEEFQNEPRNDITILRYSLAMKKRCCSSASIGMYLTIITIIILGLFAMTLTTNGRVEKLQLSNKLEERFMHEEYDKDHSHIEKTFMHIETVEEFWQFVDGPFVNGVFPSSDNNPHIDGLNILIGAIQFRQLRSEVSYDPMDCGASQSQFYKIYLEKYPCKVRRRYSSKNFSSQSHSAVSASNHVPFLRDTVRGHISYDLSYPENEGHVVNINSQNMSEAIASIKSLKESKWVDPALGTTFVSITFNIYNGNVNLFAVVELGIEFWLTGGATSNFDVTVFQLFPSVENLELELGLAIAVAVCFALRCIIESKEFSSSYIDSFESEENLIIPMNQHEIQGVIEKAKQSEKSKRNLLIVPKRQLTPTKARSQTHLAHLHGIHTLVSEERAETIGECLKRIERYKFNDANVTTWGSWLRARFHFAKFYCLFWSGCCGIAFISPKRKRCSYLSNAYYVCGKCCKKNRYIRHGWNYFEIGSVIMSWVFFMHYWPSLEVREKLQHQLQEHFQNELENASIYYDMAPFAHLQGLCQDLASMLFGIAGIHSLNVLQKLPYFGPRIQAITYTVANPEVLPFYVFLLLILFVFGMGLHFAYGNEIMEYRYWHMSWTNTWYVSNGDFNFAFEEIQESTLAAAYVILYVLSIVIALIMMNIFIAVISDAYTESIQRSKADFEKLIIDKAFYESRLIQTVEIISRKISGGKIKKQSIMLSIRDIIVNKYFAPAKDIAFANFQKSAEDSNQNEDKTSEEFKDLKDLVRNKMMDQQIKIKEIDRKLDKTVLAMTKLLKKVINRK